MKRGRRHNLRNPIPRDVSIISHRVPPYVIKWHAVNDWAIESLGDLDISVAPSRDRRVEAIRGSRVRDLLDDEEAYSAGIPLESLDEQFPRGPSRAVGGTRRVMIRLFTWIPDRTGQIAYSPQWIIAGHGFSAHSASASIARYIRSYALAVSRGIESRRLIVTAMDVVWWTANEKTDYV
jgi:hypothetical protein